LTYQWSFVSKPAGSNAVLADSTTAKPSFTADVNGTYVVQLVVNDGLVNSIPDTVTVTASSGGQCNVAFCGQADHYEIGIGDPDKDQIAIECITGPEGATVSNQMDGEYVVTGKYRLGSLNQAEISLHWGGTTAYSAHEPYEIEQPGEGTFRVGVVKIFGGSGNMYLIMESDFGAMFASVPMNQCQAATASMDKAPLTIFGLPARGSVVNYGDGHVLVESSVVYVEQ
jgi:hypothetical protein